MRGTEFVIRFDVDMKSRKRGRAFDTGLVISTRVQGIHLLLLYDSRSI